MVPNQCKKVNANILIGGTTLVQLSNTKFLSVILSFDGLTLDGIQLIYF